MTEITFPNGFYLSDRLMTPALNDRAFSFINSEYLENGAALFGRETPQSLQDFRDAMGTALNDVTDEETYAIIQFAVQRIRSIRKICSLKLARYKYARVVDSIGDANKFAICGLMRDKYFRVGVAALNLEAFAQLSIEEQASILDHASEVAMDDRIVRTFAFEEGKVIPDSLVWDGLGHPPFHRLCTCTAFGVDKEQVEGPSQNQSGHIKLSVSVTRS